MYESLFTLLNQKPIKFPHRSNPYTSNYKNAEERSLFFFLKLFKTKISKNEKSEEGKQLMNETIKRIRVIRDNQSRNHDDTEQRKPLLFDYHAHKDSYSLVQTRILNVAVHTWEQMHTKPLSLSLSLVLLFVNQVSNSKWLPA